MEPAVSWALPSLFRKCKDLFKLWKAAFEDGLLKNPSGTKIYSNQSSLNSFFIFQKLLRFILGIATSLIITRFFIFSSWNDRFRNQLQDIDK